ncbi:MULTISPECIES: DUF262 domain-containing protein [Fusobacterium]|jgi:hypothetical protein|uniref:DUF262 domain-containing protein n=1 Tax=Fusobacterium TaxID=848 RepID=UPI00045032AF|nr:MULTISPECIES: DUF262 domain-containing protein [Fusobacterium]EUB30701.1 PF03235 domain protein [Fusobacterium sp. OBRC1]WRL73474.1 DUF262 domain-containing protein [Fusobacterium polymorphum]
MGSEILGGKYKVSSKDVSDLDSMMKKGELIYAPYYQRNFVWDMKDQIEFIETILLGYPCPEIFIAEGKRDLERNIKYIHVIDGQQRLTTIKRFINNEFPVKEKYYKELSDEEKTKFLDYEIGTVTLKLNPEQDILEIEEIFRRLNKNKYTLNETEKRVSLLSNNNFMLFARLLSGDLIIKENEDLEENEENLFINNPFITSEFKKWASDKDFEKIVNYIEERVYSPKQIKQNYATKDIIDIIGTYIKGNFFSRILLEDEIVELTNEVDKKKTKIFTLFSKIIDIFLKTKFPIYEGSRKKDYFMTRGNFFTLVLAFMLNDEFIENINIELFEKNLHNFLKTIPDMYVQSVKNSVMDKKQRETRHKYITEILSKSLN